MGPPEHEQSLERVGKKAHRNGQHRRRQKHGDAAAIGPTEQADPDDVGDSIDPEESQDQGEVAPPEDQAPRRLKIEQDPDHRSDCRRKRISKADQNESREQSVTEYRIEPCHEKKANEANPQQSTEEREGTVERSLSIRRGGIQSGRRRAARRGRVREHCYNSPMSIQSNE